MMTMVDEYLSRAAKRTVAHEKMSRARLQDMGAWATNAIEYTHKH